MLTPDDVHHRRAQRMLEQRECTLRAAWSQHPERFVHGAPKPHPLPEEVWTNPPDAAATPQIAQSIMTSAVSMPLTGSGTQRRHHWLIPQRQCQLPGLVAFVRAVHDERGTIVLLTKLIQQPTPFRGVVGLSRRERERDSGSSIRGNHMNLGGPTAAGSADGLGAFFFSAPVPSGWTLTMVLSIDIASSLMRTICSR